MLRTSVTSEFGTLRSALVHDACNSVDTTMEDLHRLIPADELKDHPESGPSAKDRIIEQHARFRKILAEHGVVLHSPETQPDAFCQVFTRDPCFVVGDTLFVASLRDEYRHSETAGLTSIRQQVEKVVDLGGDGARIEGGDMMAMASGRRVLVGMNRHTNEAGCAKLERELARSGIEVIRVPHRALHLDCCLAPLPNGEALYCASKLPEASIEVLRPNFQQLIPLDHHEAVMHLAGNIFWINERAVVSNTAAVHTNRLLVTLILFGAGGYCLIPV